MDKPRVCVVPPANMMVDSGSTLYARSLLRALVALGIHVSVVAQHAPDGLDVEVLPVHGVLPHPYEDNQGTVGSVFTRSIENTMRAIVPGLQSGKWHVVHAIYPSYPGMVAAQATSCFDVASVISCFGRIVNVGAALDGRYRKLAKSSLAVADGVITPNDTVTSVVVDEYGVNPALVRVVPNGLDLESFATVPRSPAPPRSALRVLMVCSCLSEDKGISDVLRAVAKVCGRGLSVNLTVVGPDPTGDQRFDRSFRMQAAALGLTDACFTGAITHADIPSYMANADVLVDARHVGSFSNVVIEALANGLPVVASRVGGSANFIDDGVSGLLFGVADSAALADMLTELAASPERLHVLGGGARAWFSAHGKEFTIKAHAQSVVDVYVQAVDRRRGLPVGGRLSDREES